MKLPNKLKQNKGFTIVELLIVIVVIGILVTISVLTYSGISSRANVATIQSDLDSNSRKLQLYYSLYNSYPTTLDANKCPSAPTVDANYCLKLSTNNTVNSYSATSSTFTLNIANGSLCYQVTESTTPTNACGNAGTSTYATVTSVTNAANPTSLPSGWVPAEATLAATYYDYSSGGINYRVYVWTSGTGTVTIGTAGLADVLLVGGGGGGASYGGAGGGAGGMYEATHFLNAGSYSITVGAGGLKFPGYATQTLGSGGTGSATLLGTYVAAGGGGGFSGGHSTGPSPSGGGSGGGGGAVGGTGIPTQGNNGAVGTSVSGYVLSGGGGGAGASATDKNGGIGKQSAITGSLTYFAGGGGGGGDSRTGVSGGTGGTGGGGNGSTNTSVNGGNGTVNTGGGGGGGAVVSGVNDPGNGGSGVVILRIRL